MKIVKGIQSAGISMATLYALQEGMQRGYLGAFIAINCPKHLPILGFGIVSFTAEVISKRNRLMMILPTAAVAGMVDSYVFHLMKKS